jgi:hypothetical protein
VVIGAFDIFRSFLSPGKADSVLVVDANAVLPSPSALQRFEPVTFESCQVCERFRRIKPDQARAGGILDVPEFLTRSLPNRTQGGHAGY